MALFKVQGIERRDIVHDVFAVEHNEEGQLCFLVWVGEWCWVVAKRFRPYEG